MRSALGLLVCTLFAGSLALQGQSTIHVPVDQPTIQAGIDAASAGDTVLVAPGTYNENIDFKGKAITVTSFGGPAVTTLFGGPQAPTVLFATGESRNSILSNLTISGGEAGPEIVHPTGAIFLERASATILNNTITNTQCSGIRGDRSSPLIQGNEISATHAPNRCGGFGIALYLAIPGVVPVIVGNVIENNAEGGGVSIDDSSGDPASVNPPVLQANIVRNNAPSPSVIEASYGGGIHLYNTGGLLINNLIYGNLATGAGGGVGLNTIGTGSLPVTFINNTITANQVVPLAQLHDYFTPPGGTQVYSSGGVATTFVNNIITSATGDAALICFGDNVANAPVTFSHNDIYNAAGAAVTSIAPSTCVYPSGTDGNLSVDPLFVQPSTSTYTVESGSPAIDAGDNSAIQLAAAAGVTFTTDLDGRPRVTDGTGKSTPIIDMGAYEYQAGPTSTTTLSCNPAVISVGGTAILTGVVIASGSTPTGTLSLTDNKVPVAQLPLTSGVATYSYTGQAAGTHLLNVAYPATATLAGSSASCSIQVTGLASHAVLQVTPTSSNFGSPITLTAAVSPATPPGAGQPTGTVTFSNGTTVLGTAPLAANIASETLSSLSGGAANLSCTYSGDSIYAPSVCNVVPVSVAAVPSTLTLTSSANPIVASAPYTFTVHLALGNTPAPAGSTVQLSSGSSFSISLTTDASGTATLPGPQLPPGTYPIVATFGGTSSLLASSASLYETVTGYVTATSLSVSPNPAYQGQPVTLSAALAVLSATLGAPSSSIPLGQITFYDGASTLGTAPLSASGQATLVTSTLSVGAHNLTASYAANGPFLGSASAGVADTILASGFTISLTPSPLTLPRGQAGNVTISLGSLGNFAGPLALSFGALPNYAGASVNPGTVSLTAGGTGTATLQIYTSTGPMAAIASPHRPGTRTSPLLFSALLLLPLGAVRSRRFRHLRHLLCLCLAGVLLGTLAGCTTLRVPFDLAAAGTYHVPVTATDSTGHQQSATLTVVVTP